jgi:hypothetical protein
MKDLSVVPFTIEVPFTMAMHNKKEDLTHSSKGVLCCHKWAPTNGDFFFALALLNCADVSYISRKLFPFS